MTEATEMEERCSIGNLTLSDRLDEGIKAQASVQKDGSQSRAAGLRRPLFWISLANGLFIGWRPPWMGKKDKHTKREYVSQALKSQSQTFYEQFSINVQINIQICYIQRHPHNLCYYLWVIMQIHFQQEKFCHRLFQNQSILVFIPA